MSSENSVKDYCKYEPVYSEEIATKLETEFQRVQGQTYLDHAGATLYSDSQMRNVFQDLQTNLYANPHSLNSSSKLTASTIDQVRYRILNHFKTTPEEYTVIFTSGATAALKTVGECFNYNNGVLWYTQENHTSVLGLRQYAPTFKPLSYKEFQELVSRELPSQEGNNLLVFPAQSNFSGVKYPLEIINKIEVTRNWYCFLDAASYLSTSRLDLSQIKPDFVCVSFYKLFGYPTGIGALLVKNTSADVLDKVYFGGGSVEIAMARQKFHVFRDNLTERFEDGTLSYLSIIALQHGFNVLENTFSLTMEMISKHVFELSRYLHHSLEVLHHSNGIPVVVLYGSKFQNPESQGGIVTFNLKRDTGEYVGFTEIMHMGNLYDIHLRTGCFCNPGGCQYYLQLSDTDVLNHFKAGHVCGDQHDLVNGVPTGAVRVSFGYMSTKRDVDYFLKMISECFITHPVIHKIPIIPSINSIPKIPNKSLTLSHQKTYKLESILLYPIKSCGAFSVPRKWELCKTGLKYDREFMIVNHSGVCLTQKHDPKMCLIKPIIDLIKNCLILTHPNAKDVEVPLRGNTKIRELNICQSKVCMDRVECDDCGDLVAEWLEGVLERPGVRLLRQNSERVKKKMELSLTNQAQFLLINLQSINWLADLVNDDLLNRDNLVARFRPNLVITGNEAFEELSYEKLSIGINYFESAGSCTRCQMICIDQETGLKSAEPLKTLTANLNGKMRFGVYLKMENNLDSENFSFLRIGDSVTLNNL